tara:strand:- start:17 stop:139 length:123 start_codon:yes stop_codon:yes gene_type:complete
MAEEVTAAHAAIVSVEHMVSVEQPALVRDRVRVRVRPWCR